MTSLRNSVQLVGNLGNNVDLKIFESGKKKASFSLATHEYFKGKNGEKTTQSIWHQIVAWGKLAEILSQNLKKGSQVVIHGKLTYRTFENKNGETKNITEILVSDFMKINASGSKVTEV